MHFDLAAGAVELALGEIEAADDDRQHIVEIVGDAAGQLADGFHLLDLGELGLGGGALGRFGEQPPIGFAELAGALLDRTIERERPVASPSASASANSCSFSAR